MAEEKLTTKDILAKCRAADGGGATPEPAGEATDAGAPSEAAPAPPPTPSSTKDILAAARAQGGGGEAAEAGAPESTPPTSAPKSTADILAAARAQGGGAAEKPAAKSASPKSAPKSTADILAAARAQGSSGAPAAPSEKSARPKPAAAKAPQLPEGERPSPAEMLRAVREGKKSETPAPPLPRPKPAKLPGGKGQPVKRRGFLAGLAGLVATPFALGWTSLVAASTASVLGLARFMFPNVLVEPPMTFKVGPPSAFPYGTVDTSFKAARGIWIVHTTFQGRNVIYALISVCTHLGCTPSWLNAEQKFKCPCHGSGFYMNGINFEGPAPRPLERAGISLAADGMLEVDKSIKFQEELGQWEDPKSFVEVA